MDFENERYARIYTRDTITWKRLGWDGQNVLMQLIRKLDRSGSLDLGGMQPFEAVIVLCGAPPEPAKVGMDRCLDLGVLEVVQGRLLAPNFIRAQEAKAGAKERTRRWREKKHLRDEMSPTGDDASPNQETVTHERHETGQSVTDVTPSLAEPSLAEPSPPSVTLSDQAAEIYREVSGNTDLPVISPQWTPRQEQAVITMVTWSRANDLGPNEFRSELQALATNEWLRSQPVHVWADRLGTGQRRSAPDASAFDNEEDDFESLTGERNG